MDELDEYAVDMDYVLTDTDDEFKDNVLIPLQKIDTYTYVYLDDDDFKITQANWKTIHERRIEQIMNTIKKNKFVVHINISDAPKISGTFLAEWIQTNKHVTDLSINFNCEEGIQDIAYAIQIDRIITTLNFDMSPKKDACQTLIEAICKNKGIRSLGIFEFDFDPKMLFEQVIAFNNDIKHLDFQVFPKKGPFVLHELENALKANTSITSLRFYMKSKDFEQLDCNVSGFFIPKKIKKVECTFDQTTSRTDYNIEANELMLAKSITNMSQSIYEFRKKSK